MRRDDREGRLSRAACCRASLVILVAASFLAGCATRPTEPPPAPETLLLADYTTWFAADIAGNRDLLRYVLDELDADLGGVVDRTARITGGVKLLPGAPAEISAVASGAFPTGGVQFALTTNRSFERRTAEVDGRRRVYFREADGTLQLALPRDDYLYVSSGRVLEMLRDRPPAELEIHPETFRALRSVGTVDGPDALVLFEDPGVGLLGSLGVEARGLPLTAIVLSVTDRGARGTGELELAGALTLRSERDAALFGRIGRLFVIVLVRALGLDSEAVQGAATITVDGSRVVFANIPMQRQELVSAIRAIAGEP